MMIGRLWRNRARVKPLCKSPGDKRYKITLMPEWCRQQWFLFDRMHQLSQCVHYPNNPRWYFHKLIFCCFPIIWNFMAALSLSPWQPSGVLPFMLLINNFSFDYYANHWSLRDKSVGPATVLPSRMAQVEEPWPQPPSRAVSRKQGLVCLAILKTFKCGVSWDNSTCNWHCLCSREFLVSRALDQNLLVICTQTKKTKCFFLRSCTLDTKNLFLKKSSEP